MHSTGMYSLPDHTCPQPSASPPFGGSFAFGYLLRSGRFGSVGIFGTWRSAGAAIGSGVGLLMTNLANSSLPPPPPPPPPPPSALLACFLCLPCLPPPPPPSVLSSGPLSSSSVSSLSAVGPVALGGGW